MLGGTVDGMGYAIAFAAPTGIVRNLLELTNLVSMLEVYGTLDEALKAVLTDTGGAVSGSQCAIVAHGP